MNIDASTMPKLIDIISGLTPAGSIPGMREGIMEIDVIWLPRTKDKYVWQRAGLVLSADVFSEGLRGFNPSTPIGAVITY